MEEKNKGSACEQEHKKSGKRYLAFYIIGLFCVALVLILLSYVTQLRADRQLASMNSELAQKDTTVQGVQEKVVTLQDTVSEQAGKIETYEKQLADMRESLQAGEEDDLTQVIAQRMDERDAYYQLALLESAAAVEDWQTIAACLDHLESTYGAGRLDGTADNAVFTGAMADRYLQIKDQYQ